MDTFLDLISLISSESSWQRTSRNTAYILREKCSEDAHPTLGFFAEEPHSTDALQRANPMLKEAVQP